MGKTVKLEDRVYNRLEQIRDKRETFSEAVERLLDLYDMLQRLEPVVRGNQAYLEWKNARDREAVSAH